MELYNNFTKIKRHVLSSKIARFLFYYVRDGFNKEIATLVWYRELSCKISQESYKNLTRAL